MRSPRDGCRRSTILNVIHPAPRPRKSPRLHIESPQSADLQSRRRGRRIRKRRFPRQEARDQEVMGLSQRENVPKLFRTGRAQNKTTPAAKFAETQVRIGALRARSSNDAVAAFRAKRQHIALVPPQPLLERYPGRHFSVFLSSCLLRFLIRSPHAYIRHSGQLARLPLLMCSNARFRLAVITCSIKSVS